ncbi:hypothetical protein C7S20_09265 [Christiangramia fulva]|uniref:Uncharacterized protein n=1 Tax=Christiangramia fulva TaxID=2126553 RepID=A0A2R3Z5E2_9FLAO|nr:hypothetical protein [Christiangramia fulva]AVR45444.1 hypothetical protein C7S20_09265 [Christiangramia fulva]
MKFYYSAKNPDHNGMIRVHGEDCKELPDVLDRVYLGIFANGDLAKKKAQQNLLVTNIIVCKCCYD